MTPVLRVAETVPGLSRACWSKQCSAVRTDRLVSSVPLHRPSLGGARVVDDDLHHAERVGGDGGAVEDRVRLYADVVVLLERAVGWCRRARARRHGRRRASGRSRGVDMWEARGRGAAVNDPISDSSCE
jgi:hypothetical protein